MTLDSNITLVDDPVQYYGLSMRIIGSIICIIILVVGVVGNLLVIIVVLSSRTGMLTTTNCYLVSLSAADLLVLLTGNTSLLIELNVVMDKWVLFGYYGCTSFIYVQYIGVNTSALSITAFSIERFVAICYPIKAQMICTVKRAKRIIFGLWLFAVLYTSPWIYLATTKEITIPLSNNRTMTKQVCTFRMKRTDPRYMVYYISDLSLFYFIPLILLSVLYIFIARVLFRTSSSNSSNPSASSGCEMHCNNAKRALRNRIQVVKMLFVVVVMFAVLWLPYRSMVVYNSFAPKGWKIHSVWYILFTRMLLFVNSAINPVIYNAMSARFRVEFRRLLSCCDGSTANGRHYMMNQRASIAEITNNGVKTSQDRTSRAGSNKLSDKTEENQQRLERSLLSSNNDDGYS